jgi:hypothetical protein
MTLKFHFLAWAARMKNKCLPLAVFLWLFQVVTPAVASRPTWVGVEIEAFAQARENPDVVYAVDQSSLFRSADRGKSWEALKLPDVRYGTLLAVPENHQHLILWKAGSRWSQPEYYESLDGGKT